jgi:excisionase family DNA binding protein
MNRTKLVSIKTLAEETGIPARTLRSLFHAKKIGGYKLGHRTLLFDAEKVRAALDKYEVKAVA